MSYEAGSCKPFTKDADGHPSLEIDNTVGFKLDRSVPDGVRGAKAMGNSPESMPLGGTPGKAAQGDK